MAYLSLNAIGWLHALLPHSIESRSRQPYDNWRLADGTPIGIRAVRPDDGMLLQELVGSLSMTSRYRRFFSPIHELPPDVLARFTQADPTDAMTLLAVVRRQGREGAVAMAQCAAGPYPGIAEFALVVADDWQRKGIATRMMRNVICIARAAGIERIEGDVLADNEPMLRLLLRMECEFEPHPDGADLIRASTRLVATAAKCSPLIIPAKRAESITLRA